VNSSRMSLALVAAALAGCAQMPSAVGPSAVVDLAPTRGSTVSGTVKFVQKFTYTGVPVVVVHAEVNGLPRAGGHGLHIHERGDCSSGDGMSAGGHFNPFAGRHAHYMLPERHAGDLPMLVADDNGHAELSIELDVLTIGSGPADILGRSVIVHRDPDDYTTQPTGNAGARLACGVIRRG